ncbi:bifunctional phosphopantothenoylcysteine decarboxylase/phosphopantothenate--cysteine ligase CoaBC [Falsirhodobacter sp. 20TX0035]|uniref:bifunctional phosphopantothenoylcysteine decarboxylase/phosphopantothenate--cysteine ligase CoaBC n=1 Tax=Falsirhodobacter sp. 20TX0035 TaxID=3022019 RepID=UPI00232CADD5|nr:bifunctional phosphopantothenoylcysteine decarboxylase/phosphopantothenate--cysteine ligase CoaBC [Falsirhodobacter sp. 20TX0035]MDB6452213.1 bifunctional phosphopantothenoylcysteine decarboxylase/phosphopantothenate--cysteine ligase CoaBC [Falsirhodobacter sp. 20TX0035]
MQGKRILLIIGGGIAAYKALDLIRRLSERGHAVTPVLTRAASEFVTPLSVATLSGSKVHQDLFDLTQEAEIGHIQLSRSADLIVVAPATADLLARMAQGRADDLASTLLLATDTRVLVAPAMNVRMWDQPATQRNLATLRGDGILFVGPNDGSMACGEYGPGRMAEPLEIVAAVQAAFAQGPLAGRHVLVTSGPTQEPIDPVRYIANRSSGAQGTAIARALLALGARVTFVTGPAEVPPPEGAQVVRVTTAQEMLRAVEAALPADAAIFAAAVADWRVADARTSKMKKVAGALPTLSFAENPDILHTVSHAANRPGLVIGFAAETDDVIANAAAKRRRKGCDWIVANDVSPATGIMGGTENAVTILREEGAETWPRMAKDMVARRLAEAVADALRNPKPQDIVS